MEAFEDLDVWKRSSSLAINIYRSLSQNDPLLVLDISAGE